MSTRIFSILIVALIAVGGFFMLNHPAETSLAAKPSAFVNGCIDFEVNGKGDSQQWSKADWIDLSRRGNGKLDYTARVKMLYSEKGLYFLFDGNDQILTAKFDRDYENLWNEDVFECFLWPDENNPLYFEYEISPLGYELPMLVPNFDGQQHGWLPWHYEDERKTKKAISIQGGEQKSMAAISGWRAEVFIPYKLLKPLQNVPPKPGTKWRANFYRVDHDNKNVTGWEWSHVEKTYHDIKNFGTLEFK